MSFERRSSVALLLVALVLLSGCAALPVDDGQNRSTLDLTVQNDGSDPVTFRLTVTDGDGVTQVNESERLVSGVAQAFSFTVGTTGRHEVTVAGDDWQGQLAWNADTCAHFDGTIGVSESAVTVAGECLNQR